jgi:hypothetical protein
MADESEYTLKLAIRAIDEFSRTFAKLNADLTSVQKAQAATDASNKKQQTGLQMLKGTWTELSSMLGVARQAFSAISGAINKVIGETVQYSETIRNMVRVTGMAAEEASRLVQVADDAFISIGSVEAAMKMAVRKGFNPTIEAIMALSTEYLALEDPMQRNKLLLEHFGRAGLEMGKLLEVGAEGIRKGAKASDELGLTLSGANLAAVKEYKEQLDGLNDTWEGIKTQIAMNVIPPLAAAAKAFLTLLSAQQQVTAALADHNKIVIASTKDYNTYSVEMNRSAEAANRRVITQEQYNRLMAQGGRGVVQATNAVVIMTQAEWDAKKAMDANIDTRRDGIEAMRAANAATKDLVQTEEEAKAAADAQAEAEQKVADAIKASAQAARDAVSALEAMGKATMPDLAGLLAGARRAVMGFDDIQAAYQTTAEDIAANPLMGSVLADAEVEYGAMMGAMRVQTGETKGAVAKEMRDALGIPIDEAYARLNEYIKAFKGMSDAQIHTYITEHIRRTDWGEGSPTIDDLRTCFLAGTMVRMADGSERPIEDVAVGDAVATFDEASQAFTVGTVAQLYPSTNNHHLALEFSGGRTIKVTRTHHFLTARGWVSAEELVAGDVMTASDGELVTFIAGNRTPGLVEVYNFNVEPTHTYLVRGLVVHNFEGKARGGWVSERGKPVRVGEAGEEGLIVTNGGVMVIPHAQWMGMRTNGMAGYAQTADGGGGGYTPPPILKTGRARDVFNKATYYADILRGSVSGGGGGGAASPVAQAAASMVADQAAATVAAQIVAAIPSSAELTSAVVAPVMAAQAQASIDSRQTRELLQQMVAILRQQGTATDSGRSMREAVQFLGQ